MLPRFFRIRQKMTSVPVDDVQAEVARQLAPLGGDLAGLTVAITAGSRGIAQIDTVLRACVAALTARGARPVVITAMGSHGGATAGGQLKILADYGLTEASLGCPVRATMETVIVGESRWGPIHLDRIAAEADAILVVGRVKAHTSLTGPLQSGLSKMALVGLGNQAGARVWHRAFADASLAEIAGEALPTLLAARRFIGGLALIEDQTERLALIEGVAPERLLSREPALLQRAMALMPRLPFDEVDLLIVDEMGKNISGVGLDSNVVGRKHDDNKAAPGERPRVRQILCRSLTPESQGNAIGIGIVDFAPQRLIDQIDLTATRINALTSGHLGAAKLPLIYDTEAQILAAALPALGRPSPQALRIVWVRNTLELAELLCSEAYLGEATQRDDLEITSEPAPVMLDGRGFLVSP